MKNGDEIQEVIDEFGAEVVTVYQSSADSQLSIAHYKIGHEHWLSLFDDCNVNKERINLTDRGLIALYKVLKEIVKE